MGEFVRALVDTTEVWWCTTWRHRANDEIARHLGIEPLPVVTDGEQSRSVSWKAAAARPLVENALAEGREVYWIEDFYGDPPVDELPHGMTFVDTTVKPPRGVLRANDLPEGLGFRVGMSIVLEMLDSEDFETTDPTAGTKKQR
jgi:hypothetical protein